MFKFIQMCRGLVPTSNTLSHFLGKMCRGYSSDRCRVCGDNKSEFGLVVFCDAGRDRSQ